MKAPFIAEEHLLQFFSFQPFSFSDRSGKVEDVSCLFVFFACLVLKRSLAQLI